MNDSLYMSTVRKMAFDPRLMKMRQFRQHGSSNTYDHTLHVAIGAYKLAKWTHLKVDEESMARGAMLHDFYLYDIKESGYSAWRHGTGHAMVALENAEQEFDLNDKERNIIYSHMWPLNITHVPKCRESVLIGIADKYAAVAERFHVGRGFFNLSRSAAERV